MRDTIMILGALALGAAGSEKRASAEPARAAAGAAPAATPAKKLFLDVHDLGRGNVTAQAAAGAHKKDLATQGKHGVDFKAYWVDEEQGKIYCLAEAPSAEAVNQVHREAHGLLAEKVAEVTGDTAHWSPAPSKNLYLDVHHFGPGKVDAHAVAEAHKKDLAAQSHHDARFLNYWFDPDSGTVMCLVEAPSSDAALAVHKEAHGLMPQSIQKVQEGR